MHPELIQTNFFTIYTLWVFFAIGAILSIIVLIKLSVKNGLKIQFLSENSWKIIVWGLVGARIFALIQNYSTYFYEFSFNTFFQLFYIWDKGLSLFGALIGISIYFFFLCKKEKQDFFKWLDVIVPSIILGLAIGHLGAFFEGSNYGEPTSLPWGVNFESPQIKYTVPIHPTQIYAFLYSMAIFGGYLFLNHLEKIKKLKYSGFLGFLGITVYSFFNFLEQFIRGDDVLLIFGMRISQIFSFIIFLTFSIFIYLYFKKPKTLHLQEK